MNTKDLTVLALVVAVLLTGVLVVSVSPKNGEKQPFAQSVKKQQPGQGTTGTEAVQATAEVVADNVKTQVEVQ